jgi:hypothetical protein
MFDCVMNCLTKYINKNNIKLLIQSYTELSFIDIVNKINSIKNKIYFNKMACDLYLDLYIIILTNDHFIKITILNNNKYITVEKIKYLLQKKQKYIGMMKVSNTILPKKYNTTDKYETKYLNMILQNYNVELYNIRLVSSENTFYFRRHVDVDLKYINSWCSIKNIFKHNIISEKMKPVILAYETFLSARKQFTIEYISINNLKQNVIY